MTLKRTWIRQSARRLPAFKFTEDRHWLRRTTATQCPLGMAGALDFEEFRHSSTAAFPPQPFHGLVSAHDECDGGIALRRYLPGKHWDEVSAEFVDYNSGSLPLLEPGALTAFLPAWLLRSMETLGDESVL